MRTPSDSKSLILALPAAFAASIATALVIVQFADVNALWRAEAVASFLAAAVWMFVGLKLSSRSMASGTVLFLAGSAVAWFLCRALVHTASPYYGLTSFAAAVIGGALVWTALGQGARARVISVAVPIVTLAIVALGALSRPNLGFARTLVQADGTERQVHVVFVGDSIYAWTADSLFTDGSVQFERDPGSGAGVYRLQAVADSETRAAVCERLSAVTRALVASEVRNGSIPAFITRIGYREADCLSGHIWAVLH